MIVLWSRPIESTAGKRTQFGYCALTQFDLSQKSGMGLRFVRELFPFLESLYYLDPEINHHGHQFARSAYNSLIDRYCSFLVGTPSERHQTLIGQYPQLKQDLSQKEIAEYLQITPTYLSRIRKELLGKAK